jgi:hypothetical protein
MLQLAQIAATRDGGVQALDPLTAVASRARLQEKAEAVRAGKARGGTLHCISSGNQTIFSTVALTHHTTKFFNFRLPSS